MPGCLSISAEKIVISDVAAPGWRLKFQNFLIPSDRINGNGDIQPAGYVDGNLAGNQDQVPGDSGIIIFQHHIYQDNMPLYLHNNLILYKFGILPLDTSRTLLYNTRSGLN